MSTKDAIHGIFSQVPDTYERVNHILTLGFDIRWRRTAARQAARQGRTHWLDACCGTGEMAVELARLAGRDTLVQACDFTVPMLAAAARKAEARRVRFFAGDAEGLPLAPESLDLVTISFATRNLNRSQGSLGAALREFHRVLRVGGSFLSLETSQPRLAPLRWVLHLYVRLTVRRVGSALSGAPAAYAYLAHTIPRFHDGDELAGILQAAGFRRVTVRRLLGGVAAIHQAWK